MADGLDAGQPDGVSAPDGLKGHQAVFEQAFRLRVLEPDFGARIHL